MTLGRYDIPATRVDLVPLTLSLIVLPVFLDILSTWLERYQRYGDLDACTFNVECTFPVGPLADVGRAVTCSCYVFHGRNVAVAAICSTLQTYYQTCSSFSLLKKRLTCFI